MNYEKAYNELLDKYNCLQTELVRIDEERDIYEQILRSTRRTVALINLNREIIWINKTAVNRFGYSLEEVKGKRIADLIYGPDTDFSMVPAAFENALKGISTHFEHLLYTKSGDKFWSKTEIRPYCNSHGEIDKLIIYGMDISHEKALQEEIKEAEIRYKEIQDNSPDVIYTIDLSGNLLSVNNTWTTLLGYSKTKSIGKKINEFFYYEDVHKIIQERQRLSTGDSTSFNVDVRFKTKDGNLLWVNTTGIPIYSEKKEVIGFSAVSRDISREKREKQLKLLLTAQVSDLLCLHDAETRYTFVSPSIKEIAGYEPAELIGKPSFMFYHPEDLPKVIEYRNRNNLGKLYPGESVTLRYLKKDGSYTWLELTGKTIYDEKRNITGAVTCCKVANLKKEEENRIQAALEEEKKLNELKSSFLRFVAHEFKAPISVIRALVELMQMSIEDKDVNLDQMEQDLNGIEVEVKSLITLMEDVLVLEELESGTIKLKMGTYSLIDMLKNVNERLPFDWRQKATIEVEGKEMGIKGDKKYLELILKNLLSNAFKYSEGKPYPVVKVVFSKKEVKVTVKDFGIGIPVEYQEKLFTNFYRAGNVGGVDGTGLGLSIVKKFVELHHGSISYTTEVNVGTEMIVVLPVRGR